MIFGQQWLRYLGGTKIDLAAYKTSIGSGAAGAKIVELSFSNLLVTYPPPRLRRAARFLTLWGNVH
jgi:hypothetical protein